MKKFLISFVFIVAFGAYAFYSNTTTNAASMAVNDIQAQTSQTVSQSKNTSPPPTSSAGSASSNPPTPVSTAVAVTPAASKGEYTDGTYTGGLADAYYGNIQVEAVISGGRLTDVKFLQYPSDRRTSVAINQRAMPQLRSEALQIQSANVNGVSGASDSSMAFVQSLGAALAQAKA